MSLCKILDKVSEKYYSTKCNTTDAEYYGDKTKGEVFVSFVETARSLFLAYQNLPWSL